MQRNRALNQLQRRHAPMLEIGEDDADLRQNRRLIGAVVQGRFGQPNSVGCVLLGVREHL